MKRLLAAVFCTLCLGSAMQAVAHHADSQHVNRVVSGWPIDAFTLTDQYGKAFTEQRLQGRWTFALLGNTRCDQPCTAALSALNGMCQRIAGTEAMKTTQVLFISLDPEHDTPAGLQKYLAPFDQGFIGATGSWQTLKRLMDDLGVASRIPSGPGLVNTGNAGYAGTLLLIGPDSMVRAEFLPPFDVLLLTAEYLKTRARR